jgi:hypothetical protein
MVRKNFSFRNKSNLKSLRNKSFKEQSFQNLEFSILNDVVDPAKDKLDSPGPGQYDPHVYD